MVDFLEELKFKGVVCGIDEAGRGPWAGPVVAAAVIWPDKEGTILPKGLNDSKKISAKKREELFQYIRKNSLYGIGAASVDEIDQTNILAATKLAMQRAFVALPYPPKAALIDGNQPVALSCPSVPIVEGDAKSASIAAASIIAKVTRDRIMHVLGLAYPHYGWGGNAGYGTKQHQEAIAEHGITEHHRKSFAPIRKHLELIA